MAARDSTETSTLPLAPPGILGDTPAGKAERIRTEVMRLQNVVYLLEAALSSESHDVLENEIMPATLCDVRVRLGDVSEQLELLGRELRGPHKPAN